MEREGDRDRRPGRELEADEGQSVIDDEQLHQQRRALEYGDIAGRDAPARARPRCAARATRSPKMTAAGEGDQRQQQRPFQAAQQEGKLGRTPIVASSLHRIAEEAARDRARSTVIISQEIAR